MYEDSRSMVINAVIDRAACEWAHLGAITIETMVEAEMIGLDVEDLEDHVSKYQIQAEYEDYE